MQKWSEFNIHNYAAVRVDRKAPTAQLLEEMFAPFRVESLGHHDLTIGSEIESVQPISYGETIYQYSPTSLYINAMKVQIMHDEDGFRLNGKRELLVSALPLIDRIVVEHGAAMIHAATVDYRGHGICLPAWGGTGKTSTIAKLLKLDGVAFMGDDWAFLSRDGQLLGYAKPMFIKPHHQPIYPHLFQNKPKPLVPSRLSGPLATFSTAVHPIITAYPALANFSRRWSPEHMMVTPREAFPHATISTKADLAVTVFLERFNGSSTVVQEKEISWMVSRLVGNFHAEISRHSQEVITALAAVDLVPLERTFAEKAEVLNQALASKPAFLLQVPKSLPPDQASDVIVEHLQQILEQVGVA